LQDTAEAMEVSLFLFSPKNLKTSFKIPSEARADVTFRRLQSFKLKPGASFRWNFGPTKGVGKVDAQGLITVAGLRITSAPTALRIRIE
jgi:hypothetical protein